MTQRIFDVENEKDMADLWDIFPDDIAAIENARNGYSILRYDTGIRTGYQILKLKWHGKTEIHRPIKEATEADIGKLCAFWNKEEKFVGVLYAIHTYLTKQYIMHAGSDFLHCRRLTKQEIEELI